MSDSATFEHFINNKSAAVLSATLNHAGHVLSGNAAVMSLIASSADHYVLMSPLTETLVDQNQPEYSGRITLGNFVNSIDLLGQLTQTISGWQLLAEYDVVGLVKVNQQMHVLSDEVNGLQRLLMKEKKSIQATLDKLKKTQVMLVHSEKMNALGNMVAGVAHEINNPLAYILANVHLFHTEIRNLVTCLQSAEQLVSTDSEKNNLAEVRKKYDIDFIEDDYQDQINGTVEGLNRISDIVNQLRSFSYLDEKTWQRTNIKTCLDSAIRISMFAMKKKDINLVFNAAKTPDIECFPAELNQVFLNIITNAIQAMNTGNITITLAQQDNEIVISISDEGPGIAPEFLGRIFEPFFTTKDVGQGTGLGLSLSYQIITEAHGGTIKAANLAEKGCCITITLPVR